jgi:hypothetical protein
MIRQNLTITSHENKAEDHIRLNIQTDDKTCGYIDIIADKINFNISFKNVSFKGIESIDKNTIEYRESRLLFKFKDGQQMYYRCCPKAFEIISKHIKCYADTDKSKRTTS